MNKTCSILLLLALSTFSFPFKSSDAATEAVRDTDGEKVRAGVEYYILPVSRGRGGGLTLGTIRNDTCPLAVVQEQDELSNGLPVIFTPTDPKKGVIRLSTDHNIEFAAFTICMHSTVWKLSDFDESSQQYFVTIGGVKGNPGRETLVNWFKIEKFGAEIDQYTLLFCPSVCDVCRVICRPIGIFIDDDGVRRLALSDEPFTMKIKKV